jgi:GntR family transcriptional regulator
MEPEFAASRRPLFVQVRARIVSVLRDAYRPGDRLPSEPELAAAYGVSRPTIREVLRSLEGDGVVRRVHGVGTFVVRIEPAITSQLEVDLGITEAVAASQRRLGVQILRIATEPAPADIAKRLEVPMGTQLLWVERVIRADDMPAAHVTDAIPTGIVAAAGSPEYQGGSVYRFLEQHCGIRLVGGQAHLTAVNADRRIARLLDVPLGTALIRMEQVERTEHAQPVLFSAEEYVPSVLSLSARRSRVGWGREGGVAGPSPDEGPSEDRTRRSDAQSDR